MNINYAVQVCDTSNNQTNDRIVGTNRTEISKRCLYSFFKALEFINQRKSITQNVVLFNDSSSNELLNYINVLKNKFENQYISVIVENLKETGIKNSIQRTYEYLSKEGKHLVYQVQDDYLFYPSSIFEMIDIFFQLKNDKDTEPVVASFNPPSLWNQTYKYVPTPRTIVPGLNRYWIQTYDIPCTFLTSSTQFNAHWDLFQDFFNLLPQGIDYNLENISLNYMFTKRGVLGLIPFNSVAFHLQSEREKEKYLNWIELWEANNVQLDK